MEKAIIEQSKYKEIQELEENKLHAEEYVFDNYDMSMKLVEKPKSQKSAFSDLAKSYHPPKQNFQESRFYDEQEISQREADLKSLWDDPHGKKWPDFYDDIWDGTNGDKEKKILKFV